ncbi:MAG: hypothetical protein ACI9ON_001983 [Limisphaerales bacterium]|jgi:hypothetical protein
MCICTSKRKIVPRKSISPQPGLQKISGGIRAAWRSEIANRETIKTHPDNIKRFASRRRSSAVKASSEREPNAITMPEKPQRAIDISAKIDNDSWGSGITFFCDNKFDLFQCNCFSSEPARPLPHNRRRSGPTGWCHQLRWRLKWLGQPQGPVMSKYDQSNVFVAVERCLRKSNSNV